MLNKRILIIKLSFIAILIVPNLAWTKDIEVHFAFVGQKDDAALLGAHQGLIEANLQGRFLNQKYELELINFKNILTHDFSKYIAVLTVVDIDTYYKLVDILPNIAIFNLSIKNNLLRTACIKNALHIIPSNAMELDATNQWKKKSPHSSAKAQAWHPDFVKFAARDLNKRYKKHQQVSMNDSSWAGWAAVKMTSDTVARTKIDNSTEMLHYLKTELTFDGQKGSVMNFRETGQLRQPILLIEKNKIVAEAPVRGVAKVPALDSLGLLSCKK
ncbi:MAG: hypothetical protein CMF45_08965 [Legionellales bacterium]|nr:hypothetical protein [Legionellales bacterium]|tara:strand:+ start:1321 stop:2136 length:816 start_codon:yes stop_codon:yes gene_type:complete